MCPLPPSKCAHSERANLVACKWCTVEVLCGCVLSGFWQVVTGLLREATQYNPPPGCFRVPGAKTFL